MTYNMIDHYTMVDICLFHRKINNTEIKSFEKSNFYDNNNSNKNIDIFI